MKTDYLSEIFQSGTKGPKEHKGATLVVADLFSDQGFFHALRRWKVGLGGPGRACLQEEQRKRQRPNQRQKQRRKGQGQGQEDPWLSIISIAAAVNGLSVSQFYGKCSSETELLLRGAS